MAYFDGKPVTLATATATGGSTAVDFAGLVRSNHALQVLSTTTPAALVVTIEGSLNGTSWSTIGTWTLGTQAIGDTIWATGKPAAFIRANVTTLTGTSIAAPTVALVVDSTAAQIDAGNHVYALAAAHPVGETSIGTTSATLLNDGTHTSNNVTVPALTGDITGYYIYRSKAGVTTPTNAQWFRVVAAAQIAGVYHDLIPDASMQQTTHPALANATPILAAGQP